MYHPRGISQYQHIMDIHDLPIIQGVSQWINTLVVYQGDIILLYLKGYISEWMYINYLSILLTKGYISESM